MSVSLINAGIASGQPSSPGAMAQRAYQQDIPATTLASANMPEPASRPMQESAPSNIYATTPIGSQTGVAAYVAIMNPTVATSMRIEA